MKKVLFALAIVAAGFFVSCGGNSTSEAPVAEDTTAVEAVAVDSAASTEVDTTAAATDTTAVK